MLALVVSLLLAVPFTGPQAEQFLLTAEVVKVEEIGSGITLPKKVTLTKDGETAYAVWKTVDVVNVLTDSWRNEVAAYKLSQTLRLELVPATVHRVINEEEGSLQIWVPGCVTLRDIGTPEDLRPDLAVQFHRALTFNMATNNVDASNTANYLICKDRVWLIDSSRAFQDRSKLFNFLRSRR
jgi:hypothetical protein